MIRKYFSVLGSMHKVRNILFFTTYPECMCDESLLFSMSWEIAWQGLLWNDDEWLTISLFVRNDGSFPTEFLRVEDENMIRPEAAGSWRANYSLMHNLHTYFKTVDNLPFSSASWEYSYWKFTGGNLQEHGFQFFCAICLVIAIIYTNLINFYLLRYVVHSCFPQHEVLYKWIDWDVWLCGVGYTNIKFKIKPKHNSFVLVINELIKPLQYRQADQHHTGMQHNCLLSSCFSREW